MTTSTSRYAQLLAPHGDLRLIARELLVSPLSIPGVPGKWAPTADGNARVVLAADEHLLLDGRRLPSTVGGSIVESGKPLVVNDQISITVSAEPDGCIWLQVFDAVARRARAFRGIDSYARDEKWRLPARFKPDNGNTTFHRTLGGAQLFSLPRPGWLDITFPGQTHRAEIAAFGSFHVLGFRDTAAHSSELPSGRLLWLPGPLDEVTEVDFNDALLPPCTFNPLISCPIPPASNSFPFAIPAGEREVLFASNFDHSEPLSS